MGNKEIELVLMDCRHGDKLEVVLLPIAVSVQELAKFFLYPGSPDFSEKIVCEESPFARNGTITPIKDKGIIRPVRGFYLASRDERLINLAYQWDAKTAQNIPNCNGVQVYKEAIDFIRKI